MDYSPFLEVAKRRASQDPAHDFLHVARVLKNAQIIMDQVQADEEVVTVAVLLHELFNYPKGDPRSKQSGDVCAEEAKVVLEPFNFPVSKHEQVFSCIRDHSFSKGVIPAHIEGRIVQDADRLDALGAIGMARLFATSSEMKRPFYAIEDPFGEGRAYNDKAYGLDHFYIKLNQLVNSMHTEVAKRIAEERTAFMRTYMDQLKSEIL